MYLLGVYSSPHLPIHAAVGKQGQVTELSTGFKTLIPKSVEDVGSMPCPSPPVEDSLRLICSFGQESLLTKEIPSVVHTVTTGTGPWEPKTWLCFSHNI